MNPFLHRQGIFTKYKISSSSQEDSEQRQEQQRRRRQEGPASAGAGPQTVEGRPQGQGREQGGRLQEGRTARRTHAGQKGRYTVVTEF